MAQINLYYHAGSKNHGCEAIVRSTEKILKGNNLSLFSSVLDEDVHYRLNEIINVYEDRNLTSKLRGTKKILASFSHKIHNDDYLFYTFGHKDFFSRIQKNDICMSIGGDNYCYKGQDILGYYNKKLHRLGAKTVLWGCSVEPDMVTDEIKRDLALYDLIVARETISYNLLKEINPNTMLCCDPAFQLAMSEVSLPKGFEKGNTIGINASPLAAVYGDSSLFLANYQSLIRHIITKTDYKIALIPHVVKHDNDDRTILNMLYESNRASERVILVDDMDCRELKYLISQCELFVGARTHATIAAYSTCVPTLVTGYSVKARGIAHDIFGTDHHYVVRVQSMNNQLELTNEFCWLSDNKTQIKNHLEKVMPDYSKSILLSRDKLETLL